MPYAIPHLRDFAAAALVVGFVMTVSPLVARATADEATTQIKFENGHFEPAAFNVAAGAPIKLTVLNKSDSVIEFESFELNRERVVQPGGSITVLLPKLDPGQYHFYDDFHHEVPQGTINAQ
jgi:plastocyanin